MEDQFWNSGLTGVLEDCTQDILYIAFVVSVDKVLQCRQGSQTAMSKLLIGYLGKISMRINFFMMVRKIFPDDSHIKFKICILGLCAWI